MAQAGIDFDFKTDKGFIFCLTPRNDGRECDKWNTLSKTKIERRGCLGAEIFQVRVVAHPGIYNLINQPWVVNLECIQKRKAAATLYKQGIQGGLKITWSDQVFLWYVDKGCAWMDICTTPLFCMWWIQIHHTCTQVSCGYALHWCLCELCMVEMLTRAAVNDDEMLAVLFKDLLMSD